jgi:cell division septum initiation protein DivIVA
VAKPRLGRNEQQLRESYELVWREREQLAAEVRDLRARVEVIDQERAALEDASERVESEQEARRERLERQLVTALEIAAHTSTQVRENARGEANAAVRKARQRAEAILAEAERHHSELSREVESLRRAASEVVRAAEREAETLAARARAEAERVRLDAQSTANRILTAAEARAADLVSQAEQERTRLESEVEETRSGYRDFLAALERLAVDKPPTAAQDR